MSAAYDIAIVGGGINGCGIARDAAGRGLKVLLCEKGDLGGATSSASTKLIHGGLRYLEHREFRLVRHALRERECLWRIAPHIIWPLRFVLPHRKELRPAWLLRLGLFLYDHLGGRERLPATRTLRLDADEAGLPLKNRSVLGFEYSDCWVQDNRLVVLNARDAATRGADVRVRTRFISARRHLTNWEVDVREDSGAIQRVSARMLVNAAGPWVDEVLNQVTGRRTAGRVRLVQGSHIVVPKLYNDERCYIFQNADRRIIFAIPYENDFTLIGTTDRDFVGDPKDVRATSEEVSYLCSIASQYFRAQIDASDVVWTYSGVRPLYNDDAGSPQETTRDYALTLDEDGGAPLLSVFGGKITTYRRLAEDALARMAHFEPRCSAQLAWTSTAALPGGNFPQDGARRLAADLMRQYQFLDHRKAWRFVRHYGTESATILGEATSERDLGQRFGPDLSEAEVRHLMHHEYARTAADVVWRRTKSGLRMSAAEIQDLDNWMANQRRTGVLPTDTG